MDLLTKPQRTVCLGTQSSALNAILDIPPLPPIYRREAAVIKLKIYGHWFNTQVCVWPLQNTEPGINMFRIFTVSAKTGSLP